MAEELSEKSDQIRSIIARGFLRKLLGKYLFTRPDKIRFRYGEFGKPNLDVAQNDYKLAFNLTHSHEWIAIAVTCKRVIGIDVEYINSNIKYRDMLDIVLTKSERECFDELREECQEKAFYNLWTLKEAFMKATGTGFSVPPTDINITFDDTQFNRLLAAVAESDPSRWHVRRFDIDDRYAGALVVEGAVRKLEFMNWKLSPS